MTLGLYIGDDAEASSWVDLIRRFGAWTGLTPLVESRSMADGRRVVLACLAHPAIAQSSLPLHAAENLVFVRSCRGDTVRESASDLWRQIEQAPTRNEVRIAVKLDSGELRASVPMATPEQVFYCDDELGFVLASDMRLVMQWAGGSVKPASLFALFRYGTIPAKLSLSEKVIRVPPGHLLKIRPGRDAMTLSPFPGLADGSGRLPAGADSEALLCQVIDAQLGQLPEAPVLYFSGGVDSSLLASRLKRLGRHDAILMSFAFDQHDDEARLAPRVAAHLGLRWERIMFDPHDVTSLLTRIGRDYSYPFGDDSTIPTNLLVHASLKAIGPGRTILEGTGADGGFGPVVRRPDLWQWLYGAPTPVRRLLGAGYKWLRLWEQNPRVPKVRMLASVARQSVRTELEMAAVLSSNALDGVAYSMPHYVREELHEAFGHPLRLWGGPLSRGERFALLDLIYICAGRFAAKSFDPLRQGGMDPVYPFLEPDMLRVSFRLPWEEKVRDGEGKVLIKRLLAREVPGEWVYRRKSAFDAPLDRVLAQTNVQEFFHSVVLSSRNPVVDLLEVAVVKKLMERCRESKPVEMSALRFLWTILFASAWLTEVDNRLTRRAEVFSCKRR
jgi:asparagine synthetase B (glutamine-hydrolysing)